MDKLPQIIVIIVSLFGIVITIKAWIAFNKRMKNLKYTDKSGYNLKKKAHDDKSKGDIGS